MKDVNFSDVLINFGTENLIKFIDTSVRDKHILNGTQMIPTLDDYENRVILTTDGELYISPMIIAKGCFTLTEYEGRGISLFSIPAYMGNCTILTEDSINLNLSPNKKAYLYDEVCYNLNLYSGDKEQYPNLISLVNDEIYNGYVEGALMLQFPKIWNKIVTKYFEDDFINNARKKYIDSVLKYM